jgi:hypothetical protein
VTVTEEVPGWPPAAASDTLVAAEWIATIPGFCRDVVGAELPPSVIPAPGGDQPSPWLRTGFVTVAWAGGGRDPDVPRSAPVIEVKCWAAEPGSGDAPWNQAEAIGTAIWRATLARVGINRPLTPEADGVIYPVAVVQGAYMATPFRRLYGDAADYACVQGNLALSWVTPSLTIP